MVCTRAHAGPGTGAARRDARWRDKVELNATPLWLLLIGREGDGGEASQRERSAQPRLHGRLGIGGSGRQRAAHGIRGAGHGRAERGELRSGCKRARTLQLRLLARCLQAGLRGLARSSLGGMQVRRKSAAGARG